MSRIDFYHLQKQNLEEVLPKLLQKALASGKHILLKTTSETLEEINTYLWTFSDESFLPHGSKKDGFAAQQPIWITDNDENPNAAEFLFLINGTDADIANASKYTRIFNLFDGRSPEALTQARTLWKKYKEAGFEVYYWQQTAAGAWQQKS